MNLIFGIVIGLAIVAIVISLMCCFIASGKNSEIETIKHKKNI